MRCGVLTSGNIKNNIGKVSTYKGITTKKISYVLRIPKHPILSDKLRIEPSKKLKYFEYDNMLFSRIRSIEKEEYEGFVYDLNIEDNHNYLTHMGLVHNSGKRNGSIAFYLEPHHQDIMEFLQLRKNHGNEDERCRDLFLAVWLSDLFMKRVEKNEEWSLMDPDECPGLNDVYGDEFEELYTRYESEGRERKRVIVRQIWKLILDSQIETGTPYILYKDNINRKSNQKNIGVIKSSNLCVASETKILTDQGYYQISELEDMDVNVWNGKNSVEQQ